MLELIVIIICSFVALILICGLCFTMGYREGVKDRLLKDVEMLDQFKIPSVNISLSTSSVYPLDKYEILFPAELVDFILKEVKEDNYLLFMGALLNSLEESKKELPEDTKLVILRAISYKPSLNTLKYVFEPIPVLK